MLGGRGIWLVRCCLAFGNGLMWARRKMGGRNWEWDASFICKDLGTAALHERTKASEGTRSVTHNDVSIRKVSRLDGGQEGSRNVA